VSAVGQRFATVVALDDGDGFGRVAPRFHEARDAQRCLVAERDVSLHVGELFLNELIVLKYFREQPSRQGLRRCQFAGIMNSSKNAALCP
jgi:hypothetical protein